MKQFDELVDIIDRLLGPGGCPWDQEQTLEKLRPSVLEEACEVIEAIDLGDNHHIQEELGDLLFNALFFCKVAEKEGRLKTPDVIQELNEKLIRRHPHVFGEGIAKTSKDVVRQWEELKKQEKTKTHRESIFDSLPKGLPALTRSQKMFKKMHKKIPQEVIYTNLFENEESLGELLYQLTAEAEAKGLDAEHALRKKLSVLEKGFREKEIAGK
jgi:tetrapyrrole methylase family protein/MazG family protein